MSAAAKNDGFEARIFSEMRKRVIKSFMDKIIMTWLRSGPLSGYDVISYIKAEFNLFVSSGTVYSLLYSLEPNGQVEGVWKERRRTYKLKDKGEETLSTIVTAQEENQGFPRRNTQATAQTTISSAVQE